MEKRNNLCEIFQNISAPRTVEQNAIIYNQDETSDYFYYLKSGKVQIFITSENGFEKILSIVSKDEIFGEADFFEEQLRMSSARTLTDCEIISVNRGMLTRIIQDDPETAFDIFKLQAKTILKLSSRLDNMTFVSAKGRIARFLLQSLKSPEQRKISTTHEEIANIIGVTRVTVSKIIIQLVRDDVIKTSYKSIEILDKEKFIMLCE